MRKSVAIIIIFLVTAGAIAGFKILTWEFNSQVPRSDFDTNLDTKAVAVSTWELNSQVPRSDLGTIISRRVPDGWFEYQNAAYHFSLFYPEGLEVSEYSEGGGAMTITFQNIEKTEGFQIFIVPYSESQITEERFRQDVPSGVATDLASITVDGAAGTAFYSQNALLGETREVWFIHNGFLYEVTAPLALDAWLTAILQTWKF